ncbi:hypothetical protein [Actinosynnema sp.]|uniref:hypothetical protein n=1 Tax=Actinosynnema sp. TaxID=1872144 RepID=UPI003F84718E
MSEVLGPEEQQEIVHEVGGELVSAAPAGWRWLQLSFRSTIGVDTATFLCADESGERRRVVPPVRAMLLLKRLRGGMYAEGAGAWFTATVTVEPPGRYRVEYDYDSEPVFIPPLRGSAYALDLEHFPRAEGRIPEWLKRKLAVEA